LLNIVGSRNGFERDLPKQKFLFRNPTKINQYKLICGDNKMMVLQSENLNIAMLTCLKKILKEIETVGFKLK